MLQTGKSGDTVVQVRRTVAVGNSINTSDSDGSNRHLGPIPPVSRSPDSSVIPKQTVKIAECASKANKNVDTEVKPVRNNPSSALDDKLCSSEKTPNWNEAVEKWKAGHGEELDELMRSAKAANKGAADESGDWLFKLRPAIKSSKHTAARLKRWQPVLASIRGIAIECFSCRS